MEQCWEVIDEQTEEAVKSDGFVTIERCLLEGGAIQSGAFVGDKEM